MCSSLPGVGSIRRRSAVTKARARADAHVRVHEPVVGADRISGAEAPEDRGRHVAGSPRHALAVRDRRALGANPFAHDRDALVDDGLHQLVAAARIVRRTTVSRTGTLYAFFESGVAPATAARAAAAATSGVIVRPTRSCSPSTARRGVGATHPMTIRADATVLRSMRRTTATSQIGQS